MPKLGITGYRGVSWRIRTGGEPVHLAGVAGVWVVGVADGRGSVGGRDGGSVAVADRIGGIRGEG